jgi:hypothetical protein
MKNLCVIAFLILLGGKIFAQQSPHLAYVYPAGGKIGTTFQVVVGGQFLLSASNAFVSGEGITVTILDHSRPMNFQDFNKLRDRLKELQEKFQATRKGDAGTNVWTAADAREREEIRLKILKNPPNRTANMAMIDTVTVRVSIATNVVPGEREIRLATPNALSNPMKFCVGDLPEVTKLAAKAANPDLDKFIEKIGGRPAPNGTPKYDVHISFPTTINGQIMPGGVDRYRFSAARGQQLIIAAEARSLIPYLADAVPGWFELTLTILDSKGKELASAERFRFKPDPVLHFEVPRDGEYTVEIHDSIFRGREDFVYRVSIGELPYVTGIYPLGGKAGGKTTVTLTGWNLPEKKLTLDNSDAGPGIISAHGNFFNPVAFALDELPEISAAGNNHSDETAQPVALPVIVNGRVSQPDEAEVFKFDGRAGQQIVAEIIARRLDSPLDSFLRLTDSAGKPLAFNDDFEDKGTGLNTFHADSYLTATLPSDGTYFIHLTDTQGQGGPEFAYRLRLSEPRPDFALRIVPSSLSLRAGMSAPVTVFALRRDGFTNAIDLDLKDAPFGFSLSGAKIPAGQDKAQFTLKAPPEPTAKPVAITVAGHAVIGGKLVAHDAAPAEDMMQAFFYRHLVPSQELAVTVNGQQRAFLRDTFKILSPTPVKLSPGGTARVKISAPAYAFANRFKLELDNAPDGVSLQDVSPVNGGLEITFACDPEKMKFGASGNLICAVVPKTTPGAEKQKKKAASQTKSLTVATLPAIPFSVQ